MLQEIKDIDKLKEIAKEAIIKYTDQIEENRQLRARVAELEEEIKQRHASEQAVLAELAATDDTNAAYRAELEKENKRLRGIIAKIANGLNTPFPFPETKSEHDDLLIRSAAEAGKALQKIGSILKEDWWAWSDLPKLVKAALREEE